jgi:DNA-binding transcriptional LysR family regulator
LKPHRRTTDLAFAAAGFGREVAFEVSDASAMAGIVRAGLALGFLPAAYVEREPGLAELTAVHVADAPTRVEYLVWSDLTVRPAARAFLQQTLPA